MAKADIGLRKRDTIFDELNQMQRRISERAYHLFRDRGDLLGDAVTDWLSAEHDLIWKPAVELRQKDRQFEILAALPGVDAKDVDVQVTPADVLIKAAVNHEHVAQEGTVHVCELESGHAFRSIHFPAKIDPNSVKAEYRNGLLRLTATMATSAPPHKVDVRAV
jgi:HSP20 family protein